MKTGLEDVYREFHKTASLPRSLAERASAPLLVSPHDEWLKATFRVLIVGQETHGWGYTTNEGEPHLATVNNFSDFTASANGVESMLRGYEAFLHESEYWQRNSAFWRAFRICGKAVNCGQSSFLWTNIFKVDVQGSVVRNCSRSERELILESQRDLLKREIRLLAPDVVLFFSGPTYDPALQFAFSDISFHPFRAGTDARELAYVRSSDLAPLCLRSFHPSYLQRSRRWSTVLSMAEWLVMQAS
jgi:hypothetical protein